MKNFWKKFRRKGQHAENNKTERVTGLQKNKRGESKVESNDSPEIPNRETSDIPGLPSGSFHKSLHLKSYVVCFSLFIFRQHSIWKVASSKVT